MLSLSMAPVHRVIWYASWQLGNTAFLCCLLMPGGFDLYVSDNVHSTYSPVYWLLLIIVMIVATSFRSNPILLVQYYKLKLHKLNEVTFRKTILVSRFDLVAGKHADSSLTQLQF